MSRSRAVLFVRTLAAASLLAALVSRDALLVGSAAQAPAADATASTGQTPDPVDLAAVEKLKALGLDPASSQVMEIASWLTDVHGPRLTGSPATERAGRWAVERMKSWGLIGRNWSPGPRQPTPSLRITAFRGAGSTRSSTWR